MGKEKIPNVNNKKILFVDDHILFREGLMSLFGITQGFEVVGGAGSVSEGIEQAYRYEPDIILMDFSLPDGTGLEATRAILAHLPECKIVFLTGHETDDKLFAALRAGAKGYMLKNVAGSNLIASLRAMDRGESAVSRKMMSRVLHEFSHTPSSDSGNEQHLLKLSPRELDVLREMESSDTNLKIAHRLFISENTVKHHISNILKKLEVKNRHQAAFIARQGGLASKSSHLEEK